MYQEIYLTGFKKFADVTVNPTELVVDQLLKNPINNVHPHKLDVTVDQVDNYISTTAKSQCESNKKILNIHFGVGPNTVYYLQNCAYNCKDFRVPDNNGKVCKNEKICEKHELNESLNTSLNLKELMEKLSQNHQVTISTDPGRYLCNYVYFNSLNKLKFNNEHIDCLFVHFPPLAVKSEAQNMAFVRDLINNLLLKH